jgi:hypothetical protein
MNILSGLHAIPPVARAAILGTGAVALIAGAYLAAGGASGQGILASGIAVAGIVLIAILLFVYSRVLSAMDGRRAGPFAAKLRENSAAVPQGISDPSHRAQLDDIRKKFERGLDVFKEHGKDLYSMPWYILVGEPGSGKTEMIRRCNVGFPPGLQDTLQGTGGTVNMNWWFTNHAVILDTAGKLIFDQAPPGQTTVWKELLSLLRKGRPNCPINGMLLVIPADTLIVDTDEEIQSKAGRIAEQLDGIQRVLGVRFPVFVVISKCDKINGFREFFDGVRDPQLQNQILGWSNPADLDAVFNPEAVDQHLQTVQSRLRRRRLGLLLDPVHTDDPVNGRRIDQVDAMFAFPDGIMQLAPRLRRYLETIFVAGTWSSKPLFLRGIYFNSALREGDALDADLAAMFNVPVENLPEGKVWERERSYFIRDLLMSKVFRERGLVTRANNARKLQQQRMGLVLGAATIALVLSIGLVTVSGLRFKSKIGSHRAFWSTVSDAIVTPDATGDTRIWPVLSPEDGGYAISNPKWWNQSLQSRLEKVLSENAAEDLRYTAVVAAVAKRASKKIEMPVEFRWLRAFGVSSPSARQRDAARSVVDNALLKPMVEAMRSRIEAGEPVSPGAVAELIRLERESAALKPRGDATPWSPSALLLEIDPAFAFGDEVQQDREALNVEATSADIAVQSLYKEGGMPWPPSAAPWAAPGAGLASIEKAVASLRAGPVDPVRGGSVSARVRAVGEASARFVAAEDGPSGLLKIEDFDPSGSRDRHTRARSMWTERLASLREAAKLLDATMAELKELESQPASEWVALATKESVDGARSRLAIIVQQTPESTGAASSPPADAPADPAGATSASTPGADASEVAARLASIGDQLAGELAAIESTTRSDLTELTDRLVALQRSTLNRVTHDGAESRLYDLRLSMYAAADASLGAADEAGSVSDLGESIAKVDEAVRAGRASIDHIALAGGSEDVFARAARLCAAAMEASGSRRRADLVLSVIGRLDSEDPGAMVGSLVQSAGAGPVQVSSVPLSALRTESIDARFSPAGAAVAFEAFAGVQTALDAATNSSGRIMEAEQLKARWGKAQARVDEYTRAYLGAWMSVAERTRTLDPSLSSWSALIDALQATSAREINDGIGAALTSVRNAVNALPESRRAAMTEASRDLARINEELAQVSGASREAFAARAERTRSELVALKPDAIEARSTILSTRPTDLQTTIFAASPASLDDPTRVELWDRIALGAMTLLVDDTSPAVAGAIQESLTLGRRPPISRGQADPLSFEELARFQSAIRLITPDDAESGSGDTIGSGAPVARADVAAILGRLIGPDTIRRQRTLLARARQVGDIFASGLEYEILTLESQPPPGIHETWPFVRFHTASGASDWRQVNVNRETGVRVPVRAGSVLTLEFSRTEAKGPVGANVLQTPEGWTLAMRAIEKGRQDPVRPNVWMVPMEFGNHAFEIGVKFGRPMPLEARWPRSEEWPDPLTSDPK